MRNPIKPTYWQKAISLLVIFTFTLTGLNVHLVQAQDFRLPKPGVMVHLSPPMNPPILKGIKVHPDNPFRFDFILDKGDELMSSLPRRQAGPNALIGDPGKSELGSRLKHSGTTSDELKQEANRLIKYFLASITVPEKDLWVNLSPYEKDRIIPNSFGLTEMGRDLLAEDYMLKQITASLIYPEDEVGKRFWKRIYEESAKKYGTTNIPVNTFNKVWIVPEKAVVYENAKAGTAYVVESRLKVMLAEDYEALAKSRQNENFGGLEGDYLAMEKNTKPLSSLPRRQAGPNVSVGDLEHAGSRFPIKAFGNDKEGVNQIGSQIIREIVIPELTKEINENQNFAQLRQVYNSLILATWYKKKIKDSILSQVYADKNKVQGLSSPKSFIGDPGSSELGPRRKHSGTTNDVETIYQRYLQAFKKGVYNYIKEEQDPATKQPIPRKYFSGGFDMALTASSVPGFKPALEITEDPAQVPTGSLLDNAVIVQANTIVAGSDVFKYSKIDQAMTTPQQPAPENQNRPISQQSIDEITQLLQSFPLSDEEIARLSPVIRQSNESESKTMKLLAQNADDPTFYEFSIREAKLLIEEFMLNFKENLANSLNTGFSRADCLVKAFDDAVRNIYWGMQPPSQSKSKEPVDQQIADILKWVLKRNRPLLLVRTLKGFDVLERGWEKIEKDNPNIVRHTLTGTPATDRQQIIGARLPSEPSVDGKQTLEFREGVITRMVNIARRNPGKTYVLQIDNLEAIPVKVRNSINELLNVGRVQIPEAPEGQQELVLPENLKIVATITEGAIIRDSSLYDRFVRKWLPEYSEEDLKAVIKERFNFSDEDVDSQVMKNVYKEFFSGKLSLGQIYILCQNVAGRYRDNKINGIPSYIAHELELLKGIRAGDIGFTDQEESLTIDKVPLPPMPKQMRTELIQYINGNTSETKSMPEAITEFIKIKTGMTVTDEIRRALSAAARAMRYGNGIVRLEGPTGVGKTFFARAIAQLMGVNFYGEPINGSSKESRWHGEWTVDENGTYRLKTDTPFMNILKNGGVAALSELNTAVENDYARMGWWLIPLAQGEKQIPLDKYPQVAGGDEISPILNRNPKSLIIIDINPSETYEARAKLPILLQENTMSVQMNGNLSEEELKGIATDYLNGISDDAVKKTYADFLAKIHFALQEELRKEDRIISKDQPHVVTLRELKRAAQILVNYHPIAFDYKNFYGALDIAYVLAFNSLEDQGVVRNLIRNIINPPSPDRPMMAASGFTNLPDQAMRANPNPQPEPIGGHTLPPVKYAPIITKPTYPLKIAMLDANQPVMLIMPSTVDPKKELDESLKEVPHEVVKIRCQNPDMNYLTLFGGYLIDTEAQKRGERKFRLVNGIITDAILKAQQMAEEDKNLPKDKQRKLVLWMEGFYYLAPSLAVSLNALLQEGTLITPDGRTLQVPDNMRFFSSVSAETKPQISLAEQSRWVRLNMNLDQLSPKLAPPVKHYTLEDISRNLEQQINKIIDKPDATEDSHLTALVNAWARLCISRIEKGHALKSEDWKILHWLFNRLEFPNLILEFIKVSFSQKIDISILEEDTLNRLKSELRADKKISDDSLKVFNEIFKNHIERQEDLKLCFEVLLLVNGSISIQLQTKALILMGIMRTWLASKSSIGRNNIELYTALEIALRQRELDIDQRFEIAQLITEYLSTRNPTWELEGGLYKEILDVALEKWRQDVTDLEKLKIAQWIMQNLAIDEDETQLILKYSQSLERLLSGQMIDEKDLDVKSLLKQLGTSWKERLDGLSFWIASKIESMPPRRLDDQRKETKRRIITEMIAEAAKYYLNNKGPYAEKQIKNIVGSLRDVMTGRLPKDIKNSAARILSAIYADQIEAGQKVTLQQVEELVYQISDSDTLIQLHKAVLLESSKIDPQIIKMFQDIWHISEKEEKIKIIRNIYTDGRNDFNKSDVSSHLEELRGFIHSGDREIETKAYQAGVQVFLSTGEGKDIVDQLLALPKSPTDQDKPMVSTSTDSDDGIKKVGHMPFSPGVQLTGPTVKPINPIVNPGRWDKVADMIKDVQAKTPAGQMINIPKPTDPEEQKALEALAQADPMIHIEDQSLDPNTKKAGHTGSIHKIPGIHTSPISPPITPAAIAQAISSGVSYQSGWQASNVPEGVMAATIPVDSSIDARDRAFEDNDLITALSNKLLSNQDYDRHDQLRKKLLYIYSKWSELSDKQKESIVKILTVVYEGYVKVHEISYEEYSRLIIIGGSKYADPLKESVQILKAINKGLLDLGKLQIIKNYLQRSVETNQLTRESQMTYWGEVALMMAERGDNPDQFIIKKLLEVFETSDSLGYKASLEYLSKILQARLMRHQLDKEEIEPIFRKLLKNDRLRDIIINELQDIYILQAQQGTLTFENPWQEFEQTTDPVRELQILAWMSVKSESIVDSLSGIRITEDQKELTDLYPVFNSLLQASEAELLEPIIELVETEKDIIKAWKEGHRVVVLEGDPGGGKTDIGIDVAKRWGLPFEVYSAHGFSSIFDFIGGYTQDEHGKFILTAEPDAEGNYRIPFLQLLTHGGVLVIDEGAVGPKARALIGWLTGLARGENELILNEHVGSTPQVLKVHSEFHLIITTNPTESTAGRMDLPPEIVNNAIRLSVNNRFADSSYRELLKRWHAQFQQKSVAEDELQKALGEQIRMHQIVIDFVEQELQDNPERHLISLRDLRNWTKALHKLYAEGMSWQEALKRGFELIYLKQFTPEIREQIARKIEGRNVVNQSSEKSAHLKELFDFANKNKNKAPLNPSPSFLKPGLQLTGPQLKIIKSPSQLNPTQLQELISSKNKLFSVETQLLIKQENFKLEIPPYKILSKKEELKFLIIPDALIINLFEEALKSDKISSFQKNKIRVRILLLKVKLWAKNKLNIKTKSESPLPEEEITPMVQDIDSGHASVEEPSSEEPPSLDQAMISEESTKKDLKDTLDMGFHALLLLEPGVREEEILDSFAKDNDYELVNLEATPELMPLELLGGPFPVLPGESQNGQDFKVKPGFLTRHLIREGENPSEGKKLLVIHNIDALPERVRVALNNFLLKGYVDIRDDSGRNVRMKLPDNVKLAVTMSSTSQREFSSAFFNRFIKIHTQAAQVEVHGFSESLNWIMSNYLLDERSARKIQMLFDMIRNLQSGNYVWPSGKTFLFTVKDMFLHAQFVKMAIEEAKQNPKWDGNVDNLITQEALRLYGGRLQEDPRDIKAFVTSILKSIVPNAQETLSGAIIQSSNGGIAQLAGVPVQTHGRTEADINPILRLTLVPRMVNTLSTILRGWQAGKMVGLVGETAGAKTSMGRYLAQLMGLDYYVYSTHGQSKGRDLTAALELTETWEYRMAWREFLKRLTKGNQVIILDEVNLRPEMVWILNGLARGQKTFTVEMPGEKPLEVKVGENVHFLLTMNPDAYAGRGLLPQVFEENILRTWVPAEYPEVELEAILSDFLKNKQQAILSWAQAQRQLHTTGYQRTKDELLTAIQKDGRDKVLTSISPVERTELMKAILADPQVRQKMDAIRVKIGSQMRDVQVVFSWQWWAMQLEGKVRHVFVPLDELAREDRSPEAIIGLIIHELRHRRFTPSKEEVTNIINPQLPEELRVDLSPQWFQLSNIIEDVTIDHIEDPNLPGERPYLDAMIQEFFHSPQLNEQSAEEQAKVAEQNPVGAFLTKVLLAGYPPQDDLRMGNYPQFIQDAVHQVVDGGEQSKLYQATKSKEAVPDLRGHLDREAQYQENLRAATHRIQLMQTVFWPIVQELIKKTPEGSKQSSSQQQVIVMGLPQFSDLQPGEADQIIQQLPEGAVVVVAPPSSGSMTDEDREKDTKDYLDQLKVIKDQRAQEIAANEPLNERLMAVNSYAKMLAKKLIEIFRSPEDPSLEYAANGFFIDPVLFLLRDREPFIEEMEQEGKPNLAIGLTIDRSGSMWIYKQAVEQLMGLFITAFQAIDKNKGQFSINYFDGKYHKGKSFDEKFPAGDLNGYFAQMISEFSKGGSTSIYAAVEGIIEKYRYVNKKNKVEVVLTDGQGGDMEWDISQNRFVPSLRLKAKLEEAKRMGVQIIGVGFGTREVTVFDRYIQLDVTNALSLVEILLKVAQQSAVGQPLPMGDLSKTYSSTIRRSFLAQREINSTAMKVQRVVSAVKSGSKRLMDGIKTAIARNTDNASTSKAPIKDPGGIDFNPDKLNLQVQNSGGKIQFTIDPAMLQQLQNASGFYPVIINIQPMTDLRGFLGINQLMEVNTG